MAETYKFVGEAGIKELISLVKNFAFKVKFVTELPTEGDERTLYLVPVDGATGDNLFDEYVWNTTDSKWEKLGSASLDISLDDYAKKSDFDGLKEYIEKISEAIDNIEEGEVTAVEFDTTNAPEITVETSKTATTVTAKVTTDLSDYAKKTDIPSLDGYATEDYVDSAVKDVEDKIPVLEEITASDVDTLWDEAE